MCVIQGMTPSGRELIMTKISSVLRIVTFTLELPIMSMSKASFKLPLWKSTMDESYRTCMTSVSSA